MSRPRPLENEALVLDLVEWIAMKPRPYTEVMDAWRTSCPRFPIWEDAVEHRLITRRIDGGNSETVQVTPAGLAPLRSCGRR